MELEHRLSALLQLHLHSRLDIWLRWIGQRQLQDETGNIWVWGFGASYIIDFTVFGYGIPWIAGRSAAIYQLLMSLPVPCHMYTIIRHGLKSEFNVCQYNRKYVSITLSGSHGLIILQHFPHQNWAQISLSDIKWKYRTFMTVISKCTPRKEKHSTQSIISSADMIRTTRKSHQIPL